MPPTRPSLDSIFGPIKSGEAQSRPSLDQIFSQPPQIPQQETAPEKGMPLLTNESGGFGSSLGTALKDVAVGAGKSLIRGTRDVAGGIQKIGQTVLGTDEGIHSIDNNTPEGSQVNEQLQSKSRGEQTGGGLETIAELGAGLVTKGPEALTKAKEGYDVYKEGKESKTALEAITPKTTELTPTEYQDSLSKGKITPKTATKPAQYVLSDAEKEVALKNQHLLTSKDPVKNSIAVMEDIAKKDADVGKFLEKNNAIFNNGELKNHILNSMKDVSDITVDPTRLENLKSTMADNFINGLQKNDMKSLWEARKTFDKTIEKAFNGSPTLQNTVKREFRNAIQDFIAERTPEGVYKDSMKGMRELFNLHDTIATKAAKEKGFSLLKKFYQDHKTAFKIVGGIGGIEFAKKYGLLP